MTRVVYAIRVDFRHVGCKYVNNGGMHDDQRHRPQDINTMRLSRAAGFAVFIALGTVRARDPACSYGMEC